MGILVHAPDFKRLRYANLFPNMCPSEWSGWKHFYCGKKDQADVAHFLQIERNVALKCALIRNTMTQACAVSFSWGWPCWTVVSAKWGLPSLIHNHIIKPTDRSTLSKLLDTPCRIVSET